MYPIDREYPGDPVRAVYGLQAGLARTLTLLAPDDGRRVHATAVIDGTLTV